MLQKRLCRRELSTWAIAGGLLDATWSCCTHVCCAYLKWGRNGRSFVQAQHVFSVSFVLPAGRICNFLEAPAPVLFVLNRLLGLKTLLLFYVSLIFCFIMRYLKKFQSRKHQTILKIFFYTTVDSDENFRMVCTFYADYYFVQVLSDGLNFFIFFFLKTGFLYQVEKKKISLRRFAFPREIL